MRDQKKITGDIVDLHTARTDRLTDAERPKLRRRASQADRLDVITSIETAKRRLRVVIESEELRPILAFAFDGLQSGDRTPAQSAIFNKFFSEIAAKTQDISDGERQVYRLPRYEFAKPDLSNVSGNYLPDTAYSAFWVDDNEQHIVLLSSLLGFKDLQIVVLDGYSLSLARYAGQVGINTIWNNAPSRVSRVIAGEWIERMSGISLVTQPNQRVRFGGKDIYANLRVPL